MTDTIGQSTGTAGQLTTLGGGTNSASTTSEIDTSGDQDWFRISLSAGSTYVFGLEGAPTNMGSLSDPFLRGIYDSNGLLISGTSNDDGGTGLNSAVIFSATTTGTYYVSAGAYSTNTGSYTLTYAINFIDD